MHVLATHTSFDIDILNKNYKYMLNDTETEITYWFSQLTSNKTTINQLQRELHLMVYLSSWLPTFNGSQQLAQSEYSILFYSLWLAANLHTCCCNLFIPKRLKEYSQLAAGVTIFKDRVPESIQSMPNPYTRVKFDIILIQAL